VDSGTSISFISDQFVDSRGLVTKTLLSPFRISLFDGSASVAGDVLKYIDCLVFVPLADEHFLETLVKFHVTCLSSVDAIFGSSWLQATNTIIGGVNNDVVINGVMVSIFVVDPPANVIDEPSGKFLLEKYADVFVTYSLSSLLPHRPGFDCEVNLKPNSVPPFGKMYNLSKPEQDELKKYIFDNVQKGFIWVSSLGAAAPIFYVKVNSKADRPCVHHGAVF
jgi:hypothetical protein